MTQPERPVDKEQVVEALKTVGFKKETVDDYASRITAAEDKSREFRAKDLLGQLSQGIETDSIKTDSVEANRTLTALKTLGEALSQSDSEGKERGEKLVRDYNEYANAQQKLDSYAKNNQTAALTEEKAALFKQVHDTVRTYEFDLADAVKDLPPQLFKTQKAQTQQK